MFSVRTKSKTILHALAAMLLVLIAAVVMTHAGRMEAQTVTWAQVHRAISPSPRCCMGMVYDGATESTVLFGGQNSTPYGDTWVWRGKWSQLSPAVSPSPRGYPGMAFDEAAGNIVLFGGSSANVFGPGTCLGDTWTWDGTTWTQQFPPVSPPARTWVSMVYDPVTKRVVLFGGNNELNGNGPFGDTWTWDGITKTWTQHTPASSPSPRGSPALATTATGKVVLFGGIVANLGYLNDTWTWDGANWTQEFPASSPPELNAPSMAYDPGLGAVVLFGGALAPNAEFQNNTWTWNGTNWTQIYPANNLPPGRAAPGMDYNAIEKVMLMFGGNHSGPPLSDTWLLGLVP
jgi:hypothetical protein